MFRVNNAIVTTAILISLTTAIIWGFRIPLPASSDAFHSGEHLAAAISVLYEAPYVGDPYTIHGAADIIPALLVNRLVSSPEFLLSYTLIVYPFLALLSVFLTIAAALKLAQRFGVEPAQMTPFILLVPLCVGWRDLFFVLSLYLFILLVPDERVNRRGPALHVLFGLVAALGTYWSFNRGISTIAAFGPATLWLARRDSRFALDIGAAIAGFLLIGFLVPGVSVLGYFENFRMLLESSSIWKQPSTPEVLVWTAVIVGMVVLAIGVVAYRVYQNRLSQAQILLLVAILIGAAVYAKIGLGRVGRHHVVMAVWLPLLVVNLLSPMKLFFAPSVLKIGFIALSATIIAYLTLFQWGALVVAVTLLLALGLIVGERTQRRFPNAIFTLCLSAIAISLGLGAQSAVDGEYSWLLHIHDLPSADAAVQPGVLWSATRIKDSGSTCVFDLANTGLINAVANLPACSRFTYPVYAGPDHEGQLISDLLQSRPAAIVYKADYWSYTIDGKNMQSRFPKLDEEILRLYLREECKFGFCLRFRD